MERVESLGQIATAKSLADLLSCCPPGPGGLPALVTFDIHWVQEQFYFQDRILVELCSAVPLGRKKLVEIASKNDAIPIVIVFPDRGAQEKMSSTFLEFPQVICEKVRDGNARRVSIVEGAANIHGCHAVSSTTW